MKTVTLRRLWRESHLLDSAAGGEEIVVTRFGKPYMRILPGKTKTFLGAIIGVNHSCGVPCRTGKSKRTKLNTCNIIGTYRSKKSCWRRAFHSDSANDAMEHPM
jgi:antitoxin (DNA-binding transcriptional repressor) of toxin-antitoxin stability system